MNGQQSAEENYQKFLTWMSGKINDDYRQMVYRGQLSRKDIAAECGFGKSALNQNKRIKEALKKLENRLRVEKVLPPEVEKKTSEPLPKRDTETTSNRLDKVRLSRLEQENAALKAENQHFKEALKRYQLLEEVIADTGRMPR